MAERTARSRWVPLRHGLLRQRAARHRRDPRPGAARPPAVVEVPLAGHHRARHGVDPRRARGDDRRLDRRPADEREQRDRADRQPGADRRLDLRRRCLCRRVVLRPAHRPLRTQEALPADAGRVPDRDGRDRVRGLRPLLLRRALLHRCRHRRRVRGDQLGDRRADPGARARARRPDHQRVVLARRGLRRARRAAAAGHGDLPRGPRLAARVRDRRGLRPRDPARAPARAREPALAVHPRARGGGRADRGLDRVRGARGDRPGAARSRATRSRSASARRSRSRRSRARPSSATRGAPPSASRCSWARRSSTTP